MHGVMHSQNPNDCSHTHSFGQEQTRKGEMRTSVVILLTAVMMVFEIGAGIAFGSMALLADGLHMASHTAALGIAVFAYVYARRRAHDGRFSFGTGKVNALAGFTGAILLAVFSAIMAWESTVRFFNPVTIVFDQAIFVAVLGLVVNAVSAAILGAQHQHGHEEHHARHDHHDHNLRAAYFHVLADALTSLTAIVALLAGKYFGLNWMDPIMGIVGSVLVSKWSWGLLRESGRILLDFQAPAAVRQEMRDAIELHSEDRIADLHVWSIGPGLHAAELLIVSQNPQSPEHYKSLMPQSAGLVHISVEIHHCPNQPLGSES